MNGNTLEQQLTESLGRRADSLGTATGGPLRLDDVRSRATRIRRRRHAASAAGIAAALALLVPVGMLGLDGWDRVDTPPVVDVAPTPIAEPIVLAPDAEEGDAPRIPWIGGTRVHLPDGTTLDVAREYRDVHLVAGRVLASWNDDDTGLKTLDELGDGGEVLSSIPIIEDVVITDDQSAALWQDREYGLQLFTDDGTRDLDLRLRGSTLDSLEGGDDCTSGCALWFGEGVDGGPGRLDLDTGEVTPVVGPLALSDVHQDRLFAGLLSYNDVEPGACTGVFEDFQALWETCDNTVERFSPDGLWISATDKYMDGVGQNQLAVLDADTGERLLEFQAGAGWFVQRVWEDETHLLATHYAEDDRTWQVFRLGLDGTVELAVPPQPGTIDDGLGVILAG